MIITINGTPGSGKTTIAKAIAKKYKLKFYSIGEIRRNIARFFGLTIDEFNKIGEKYVFTDSIVDNMIKICIKDNAVIDGRLAWYFFNKSIKILVLCDKKIAAKRIFKEVKKNKRKSEKKYKNIKEIMKEIDERIKSDNKRYKKYYGIKNIFDFKNYDIIIDTSHLEKKEMIDIMLKILKLF
ncbi:MAG: cytidylate kinase family protein [Candidatus Pacearchaeota archaeon]